MNLEHIVIDGEALNQLFPLYKNAEKIFGSNSWTTKIYLMLLDYNPCGFRIVDDKVAIFCYVMESYRKQGVWTASFHQLVRENKIKGVYYPDTFLKEHLLNFWNLRIDSMDNGREIYLLEEK